MMLDIQNLWKRYGDRPVLSGLTLQVPTGEIYGLLGPNGAGKTTTINILCDLLRADSGQIAIAHRPISAATKPLIGIAPQENLLYRSLTCAENLDFFARIYGVRSPERRRRVQQCLDFVGLGARARSPVETLSGGMQRRLNLAVALVHQPKLVVLDEPTVGLDIEARYDLWDLIRHLKDQGTTVLLTTHLLDEAERLCDHIGILKQGRILAAGTLAELRSQVPAAELARLQTSDLDGAIARAQSLGWAYRVRSRELVLLLPEVLALPDILDRFAGVAIDSLARQAVDLEAIYLEVTRSVDSVD